MESELRLDLVIEGKVQGIGYRYSAKIKAESLGIRGSVQNIRDGSVFVTAQGEKEAMDNFVRWCYKGPPGAIVRNIEKVQGKTEEFSEFMVLY
ncbi:acylphosphatase [Deltaproteobacteria bacterium]|nr:acylphosphatase [Deltaproteobacteria bacterium]